MTPPAVVRHGGPALLLALLLGCTAPPDGGPPAPGAAATPEAVAELEPLVVTAVPSGLPRVPDDSLSPPAGAKSVQDVAGYAEDADREREVLDDYGYLFGWERYWGSGSGRLTTVAVHRFATAEGAGTFTEDVAAHDARVYGGRLQADPAELPAGCSLLVLPDGAPAARVASPAAFTWCPHGVFSVSVTAVAGSVEVATGEARAVTAAQLDRLPG
ncbi:hypothetical protein SAMN06893096_101618 [Geodermatophilus pulveris]|uniref:DUF7373 domain-containing protein n=1 Tax=Geodermatophilus pulveris TaxID=1564159 RepID=A0A239BEC6_9ACTN|nr:hypothetical protein [Geodermatophilus pulveris]SNS05911.1 hypothetical protein SAMN06893096_101618 [Geodermatophilus pulveris]